MNLLDFSVDVLKTTLQACTSWFSELMDKTGTLPFYFAAVVVALGAGFLLSPFRNGFAAGLSDKASDLADRVQDKKDYKLASKSGAWSSYYKNQRSKGKR